VFNEVNEEEENLRTNKAHLEQSLMDVTSSFMNAVDRLGRPELQLRLKPFLLNLQQHLRYSLASNSSAQNQRISEKEISRSIVNEQIFAPLFTQIKLNQTPTMETMLKNML
jgi:hypothetical protein